MKRVRLMVLTILVLFVMPLAFAQNVNAADGDESTDSIYGFSETLPDDVMFMLDNESYGSGYAESFTDVSDWATWEGTGIFTDGDLGYVDVPDDAVHDRVYTNVPSFTNGLNYYLEFRFRVNVTSSCSFEVLAHTEDTHGGTLTSLKGVTGRDYWQTIKVIIDESLAIESLSFAFWVSSGTGDRRYYIDDIRISPANESGWQHDCSTVASTTVLRVDVESDGDHIQFQYSGGGGTGELSFHTDIGGSNIAAIDTNYYPFIGWNVVNLTDDYYEVYVDDTLVYTGTGLGLQHANVKASGEAEYTTITFVLNTVTESMALDWVKGHSIANFTVTFDGLDSLDFMYVDDDDNLRVDVTNEVDGGYWMTLNYDPTLSVDTSMFNIWNITTDGNSDRIQIRDSISNVWSTIGETRGGFQSGILTDFQLMFGDGSDSIVSAIKFIEDGTAPIISDFWIVPYTPTEEDNVTFAIYETDAGVGTYTVIFNAVEYPDGFVDVDMDAVESSEIDGLWSYTIDSSDLPAGYYVFEVIASDGANEGTELTIFEVIDVTENIFELLFLSTEMWGYLGPVGLVVIGFLLTKKERSLGIFMIIVDSLLIAQYLALIEATPEYWWHVIILLLGVVQCAIVLIDR